MELRCEYKLHGIVHGAATGILEVKCDSALCGHERGVVVLHQFCLATGDFETKRYKQPPVGQKEH